MLYYFINNIINQTFCNFCCHLGVMLLFSTCSSANKCLLKVAMYSAQMEEYAKALEIYEQVCLCFWKQEEGVWDLMTAMAAIVMLKKWTFILLISIAIILTLLFFQMQGNSLGVDSLIYYHI